MITLGDLIAQNDANLGDRTAVCYKELTLTWSQVYTRVQRLAGALRGLGLAPGDRVAMLGNNSAEFFDFYFAVPSARGIAVPINMRLAPAEIAGVLDDCRARFLIVEPQFLELASGIRAGLTHVEHFLLMGSEPGSEPAPGFRCLEALPALPDVTGARGNIDDVAMLLYTGGTTGRPKGVMLTHHGMMTSALQWAAALELTHGERLLVPAPMFHGSGSFNCILGAMLGYPVIILPRFDPLLVLEAVQRHRPTYTAVVPTMIEMLATHPEIGKYDLTSLTRIAYGGSPMPMRTLKLGMAALPGARFYQLYGQTECGPNVTVLQPEDHVEEGSRIRSAGRAISATLVAILDPSGRKLPAGETGEICVRCPAVSPGYWQQPELSAETHRGGWHHTGDAGYLDQDNYLFVVDRIKDMIVTGGENVYAVEVENALGSHPAVAGCAVIGVPHERLVEQVHAIVRLNAGAKAEPAELIAHCRERLAGYKCPRSVEFCEHPFPLSPVGKVLKRELRKEYSDRKR